MNESMKFLVFVLLLLAMFVGKSTNAEEEARERYSYPIEIRLFGFDAIPIVPMTLGRIERVSCHVVLYPDDSHQYSDIFGLLGEVLDMGGQWNDNGFDFREVRARIDVDIPRSDSKHTLGYGLFVDRQGNFWDSKSWRGGTFRNYPSQKIRELFSELERAHCSQNP